MKKSILILLVGIFMLSLNGCSVYETLVNLSRLQFKMSEAEQVQVAGISVEGKNSIGDFSAMDILKFTQAVISGSMPVTFTLPIEAKNPNDGTGGYQKTNATIESFPYRLHINEKEVLTGNIQNPVSVPGTGEITIIPLTVSFDIVQLFENGSYEDMVNLALKLAGENNDPSTISLYAKPSVGTAIGPIEYPGDLRIVQIGFTE
jgi:hypothetical protein